MSLDEQIVTMLRDRFDSVDAKLREMSGSFDAHVEIDQAYWRKLDQQEAQVSVFKWITSGLSGSALIAWLYEKFGH